MSISVPILCCLIALWTASAHGWMGIRPKSHSARPQGPVRAEVPAGAASGPADSALAHRRVRTIPAGSRSAYLGMLQGVRCFNCAPDLVLLNIGDSAAGEAGVLAMPSAAWNAMERPVRDRRIYAYQGDCFHFAYRETDSAWVGGEWSLVRVRHLPCYPYQRQEIQAVPDGLAASGTGSSAGPTGPDSGAASAGPARREPARP